MNSASKKWELGAWMADLKEADSLKQQQKKPEEIERFTIDESVLSDFSGFLSDCVCV
jgi:hypothetical protein